MTCGNSSPLVWPGTASSLPGNGGEREGRVSTPGCDYFTGESTVVALSCGMNGVTQRELSFLLLLWGLSDPRIAELRKMPRCFSIKFRSETEVSGHLGMSGGRSPRHAQNPLSGERRKTLSITHHALSPPPSHDHLYIIHLIN